MVRISEVRIPYSEFSLQQQNYLYFSLSDWNPTNGFTLNNIYKNEKFSLFFRLPPIAANSQMKDVNVQYISSSGSTWWVSVGMILATPRTYFTQCKYSRNFGPTVIVFLNPVKTSGLLDFNFLWKVISNKGEFGVKESENNKFKKAHTVSQSCVIQR